MPLVLLVKTGPAQGQQIELKHDMLIGRQGVDFSLLDGKASTKHAKIIQDRKQQWFIFDQGSRNGTWVNGEKVTRAQIKAGSRILIGNSQIEVVAVVERSEEVQVENFQRANWKDSLVNFLRSYQTKTFDKEAQPKPFLQPIQLRVTKGLQSDTLWTLGYGPRQIGARCFDFTLLEPKAPDVCFELIPESEGIRFKTAYPRKVKLNGKAEKSQLLKIGDLISIFDTDIEVEYAE